MKSLANEFFKTMQDGATAHQQAHAAEYELIANGIKDELDVARQVEIVEQMIAQQIQAIVIAPADSKALVAVCQRAQAAGVVVINIDNKLDAAVLAERNLRIPFVGPDNRKGACPSPKYHPIPKCLAWVSCNLYARHTKMWSR
jgi:ribose transport system substrate-binding protein